MRLCSHCAGELHEGEGSCRQCGQAVAQTPSETFDFDEVRRDLAAAFGDGGKLATSAATASTSSVRAGHADPAAEPSPVAPLSDAPATSVDGRPSPVKLIAGVAVAVALGAAVTLVVLNAYPLAPQSAPSHASRDAQPPRQDRGAPKAVAAPKWSSANRTRWVSNRPKNVAYELEAENKVAVWLGQVRPMLVARCTSNKVEVFVFTESAARIEPQDEDHTVRLTFDGGAESTERWPDSAEHDALFAPDGVQFARRLGDARRLRFGFTPHNAAPAVAEFDLRGFDQVQAALADCTNGRSPRVTKVASR